MRYLALGDSISIDDYTGAPSGGAASQLAKLVGAESFQMLAYDGCTTTGVLEAAERVDGNPDLITLTAGGNDLLEACWWRVLEKPGDPPALAGLDKRVSGLLRAVLLKLGHYRCPILVSTIYDPTDGRLDLASELGLPVEAFDVFRALNDEIRSLSRIQNVHIANLEVLFSGHGFWSEDPWLVSYIEPNLAGATAIAELWHRTYIDAVSCRNE
ncbi:MAG: hypothetical protein HZC36_15230 [Armatimonadetes bacterium]|nr:hypothetical protein [Armatimonadota bacterium]